MIDKTKIDHIVNEVCECKKDGYNVDIFPDGSTYAFCGSNDNDNSIMQYHHRIAGSDRFYSNFPKTKKKIKKEIIDLFCS